MQPKMSQLIFSTEDETTTERTCVNDINAKLQITGMSRYRRRLSMQNWDSVSSSAAGKDRNGPGARGRSKSPRLDSHTHTELLSASFYHPLRHKGGNYAHFRAQPQLPEYQAEVYQKLPAAAVQGSPLERRAGIQTRKTSCRVY